MELPFPDKVIFSHNLEARDDQFVGPILPFDYDFNLKFFNVEYLLYYIKTVHNVRYKPMNLRLNVLSFINRPILIKFMGLKLAQHYIFWLRIRRFFG